MFSIDVCDNIFSLSNKNNRPQVTSTAEWMDQTLVLGSGRLKLKEGHIWNDLDLIDPLGLYVVVVVVV